MLRSTPPCPQTQEANRCSGPPSLKPIWDVVGKRGIKTRMEGRKGWGHDYVRPGDWEGRKLRGGNCLAGPDREEEEKEEEE